MIVSAATLVVLATGVSLASASSGLGISVAKDKTYIAMEDPHVHWSKPTNVNGLLQYNGTGDGGRAQYSLWP
jgi:hypothetical protein